MDKTSVWFIKAGMIYFLVSSIVGVTIAIWPEGITYYKAVHAHLNLLGWISMMIFGIGYHILPRFSGRQLHSPSIARTQFWLANIGLVGMVLSWGLIYHGRVAPDYPRIFLTFFGLIEVIAVLLFIYNIWKTIKVVEPIKTS